MPAKKLDIFETLKQADKKNYDYYSSLSSDEQKGYVPLLTMRWMTGTNDPAQIILLNEFVNPYVFNLHNERELLWKLTCACASGQPRRYRWIKNEKKKNASVAIELIANHYKYTIKQAKSALSRLSVDDVIEIAEYHGYEKTEIDKIKKEMKYV